MMDASLSMEAPETLSYKTALLKLIQTGKARTQAEIDKAATGVECTKEAFTYDQHFADLLSLNLTIASIRKTLKNRKDESKQIDALKNEYRRKHFDEKLLLQGDIFALKLNLYMYTINFCKAYLYFHLQECPSELQFDLDDPLETALYVANRLQYQSVEQLKNLYPAPQTFHNTSIQFYLPENCDCVQPFLDIDGTEEDESLHAEAVDKAYQDSATCLGLQDTPSDITQRLAYEKLEDCKSSEVFTLRRFKSINIDVPLDCPLFQSRDRVRVDEVEVYLHGAKTDNGRIEIWIQTSGLSQDRYKSKVFSFTGEPWRRGFSYFSSDARKRQREVEKRDVTESLQDMQETINTINQRIIDIDKRQQHLLELLRSHSQEKFTISEAADVHKSFQGIYRVPTVFTNWYIRVPQNANPGLDLSQLTSIKVRFAGSFIASGFTKVPSSDEQGSGEESGDEDSGSTEDDSVEPSPDHT